MNQTVVIINGERLSDVATMVLRSSVDMSINELEAIRRLANTDPDQQLMDLTVANLEAIRELMSDKN